MKTQFTLREQTQTKSQVEQANINSPSKNQELAV